MLNLLIPEKIISKIILTFILETRKCSFYLYTFHENPTTIKIWLENFF